MSESVMQLGIQLKRKSLPPAGPKGRAILVNKPQPQPKFQPIVPIFEDGKDITPRPLNPDVYTCGKERQLSVFDAPVDQITSGSTCINIFKSKSTAPFRTDLDNKTQTGLTSTVYRGSFTYLSSTGNLLRCDSEKSDDKSGQSSVFTFPSDSEDFDFLEDMMLPIPEHISLTLNETTTFILLDIPSCTEIKDTDEGVIVEEQNQQYDYLTVGKGRNRKVLHAEVQTLPSIKKTRYTNSEKIKFHTSGAFASNWEMYDTYQERKEEGSDDSTDTEVYVEPLKLDDLSSLDSYRTSQDEKQIAKLLKNSRFMEAVCVMERLLANNCYNEQQKRFIGLKDPSEFRENIEYKYNLNLLWTFANSDTKGKSVNAMHWNPLNKDILAVGYGKFYFADYLAGAVLIWNIKNPVQPERQYFFTRSVSALNFSSSDPNLLAIGLYNGYVVVLNIISREKMIVGENTPTFEPVRFITWRTSQYELNNREQVCAAFEDGRVIAYSVARKLQGQEIMRVPKADGKLKGYDSMGKCSNLSIPVSRYAAAFFVIQHPAQETIYFVGTNKGVIHKCSTNYFNQHLDHFLAHDGPVYIMKFSPFSNKIYATCGDDWHTRIWAEDISEPLLELYTKMQSVQGLDWSPTHSTILVTILGSNILIWDFQRKVYEPQSTTQSPTGTKNTVVQFTDSGRCLVVGDIDGNVHVFSLEDMPFTAFFQENLLFDSLYRALTTNPQLLHKLRKLRRSIEER